MLAYENQALKRLVTKISQAQPVNSRLAGPLSWHTLAQGVHANIGCEPEKKQWIQKGFGRLWTRFAGELTNVKISQEYNSAKHGLRTRLGGFYLSYGSEVAPGVPPPSEKDWKDLGGNDFDTSYFTLEKIIGKKRLNFWPRFQSRNWVPENLVNGLLLLSMSIHNVISFLRVINSVPPEKCLWRVPDTEADFGTPWKTVVGVTDLDLDIIITPDDIEPCTK